MGKLDVVYARSREWSEEQMRIVRDGFDATDETVVPLDMDFEPFIVLDGDEPVGVLSVAFIREGVVEVGVRFWSHRNTAIRIVEAGLRRLFEENDTVLARCYASNMRVRRLIQRAGFMLLGTDRHDGKAVHVYGLPKENFMSLFPEGTVSHG